MGLELAGVTVRFPGVTVIEAATIGLTPGVTVLTGANGAGKTTLLRLLAGLIAPAAGAVRWGGRPLDADLRAYRRTLGYLPQRQAAYPEMTVAGFMDYMSSLKAIPPDPAVRRRNALLAALGLGDVARAPLGRLSLGQQRLAGVAQALLSDPDVLLLDEPLEGLDPGNRLRVLDLIHRPGRSTVLATHRLEMVPPGMVAHWRLETGKIVVQ